MRTRSRPIGAEHGGSSVGTGAGGHQRSSGLGHLTLAQMIEKMTVNPARVLGVNRGTLEPGKPADVTILDPKAKWTIDASKFKSKSRNTPFDGWKVTGRAMATIVGGDVKMSRLG